MRIKTQPGNKDDRYTLFLIIASCACLIVQLYALPRTNTRLMSLANRGLLALWYIFGCLRILKHFLASIPKYLVSAIWLFGMSLCSLLLGLLEDSSLLVTNAIALINFFVLPIMLLYSFFYGIPKKGKTIILATSIVISLIFLQLYHSDYRYFATSYYGDYESDVVTLGYPNPNQTAMFLLVCAIGLMTGIFYFRQRIARYLLAADFFYIAWILYQTESRTAFLLLLLFTGATLANWGRKIKKGMVTLVLLTPVIYLIFALALPSISQSITVMGESIFTGREDIYQQYLDNLSIINFIFGDFNEFHFDNLHNGYISIAATGGIVSVVCYILLLKKCLEANRLNARSYYYTATAYLGFLSIVLCTSTEAAFIVGGSTYAFFIFMIFALFSQPIARKLLPQNEVAEK